jgi:hypothetical protein
MAVASELLLSRLLGRVVRIPERSRVPCFVRPSEIVSLGLGYEWKTWRRLTFEGRSGAVRDQGNAVFRGGLDDFDDIVGRARVEHGSGQASRAVGGCKTCKISARGKYGEGRGSVPHSL